LKTAYSNTRNKTLNDISAAYALTVDYLHLINAFFNRAKPSHISAPSGAVAFGGSSRYVSPSFSIWALKDQ
jgi:hypothetical protein